MAPQDLRPSLKRISNVLNQISTSGLGHTDVAQSGQDRRSSRQTRAPRQQRGDDCSTAQLPGTYRLLGDKLTVLLERMYAPTELPPKVVAAAVRSAIELQLVPRAAALLSELLQAAAHQPSCGTSLGGAATATASETSNSAESAAAAVASASSSSAPNLAGPASSTALVNRMARAAALAADLLRLLLFFARLGKLMAPSGTTAAAGYTAAAAEADRTRLYEQLCDVTLGRAMTAAVRFVHSEVWPLLAAVRTDGGPGPSPAAAGDQRVGPLSSPASSSSSVALVGERTITQLKLRCNARSALCGAAHFQYNLVLLWQSCYSNGQQNRLRCSTMPPPSLIQLQQLRQLRQLLQQTGLLAATCGALTAAPPRAFLVSGEQESASIQRVVKTPKELLCTALSCTALVTKTLLACGLQESYELQDKQALLEVLTSPEVVELQRGLLERVIQDAGGGGGGGGQGESGGSGGGSSGSGGGASCWPLLDSIPRLDKALSDLVPEAGGKARLECVHARLVALTLGAWHAVYRFLRLRPSLPSLPERMQFVLRLLRALHRLVGGCGGGGQYDLASTDSDPSKVVSMLMEAFSTLRGLQDRGQEGGAAAAAAVDGQEACGLMVAVSTELGLREWPGCCSVRKEQVLWDTQKLVLRFWIGVAAASLPRDACRSLASRLGRTRLLRVFNALLRRTATSPVARTSAEGNAHAIPPLVLVATCAHTVLESLLGDVVRESWERQLGLTASEEGRGDAGPGCDDCGERQQRRLDDVQSDPWDTKRELGFFITVSKLALREAAGLDSCQGPAAPALAMEPSDPSALTAPRLDRITGCVAGSLAFALCPVRGLLAMLRRAPPGLPASTAARLTEALTLVTRAACVLAAPLLLRAAETPGGVMQDEEACELALSLATAGLQALMALYGEVPAAALLAAQPHRLLAALGVMLGRMGAAAKTGAAEGVQSAAAASEASADFWKRCLATVDIALLQARKLLALMVVGTSGEEGEGTDASGGSAGPAVSLRAHALALLGWPAEAAGVTAAAGAALSSAGAVLLEGLAGWDTDEARALRAIWRAAAAADGGALLDWVVQRLRIIVECSNGMGERGKQLSGVVLAEVEAAVAGAVGDGSGGCAGPGAAAAAATAALPSPVVVPLVRRVLRMCGNPRCENYGGACEGALRLSRCGGCRAVHYCSVACQKQHWEGGHKPECLASRGVGARK